MSRNTLRNFNSRRSIEMINAISTFIKDEEKTSAQIACEFFISRTVVQDYVAHMEEEGLIVKRKEGKNFYYKSNGLIQIFSRDISERQTIKTDMKPFRDEWTALFFGPAKTL